MKNKTNNKILEGTYGRMMRVKDFLPQPEDLVLKDSSKKVTLTLEKESIDFFKKEAKRLNTSYQRMIRNLLQEYTKMMVKDKSTG